MNKFKLMDEVSATDQEDIPKTIEKLFRSALDRTLMDLDDGALEPAFQAMALAPNDPEILCKGASILCRRGRGLQMAEEIYARVLAIDPNYPLALNQLALLSTAHGKYSEAVEYSERLIALPEHRRPLTLLLASRALRLNGNLEESKVYLREIVDSIDTRNHSTAVRDPACLKPVAAYLGGWEDEAEQAMRDICCVDGEGVYFRNPDLYPVSIAEQLTQLRKVTEGRDVCIFGGGPSIKSIAEQAPLLARDGLVHLVINNFAIIASDILAPVGARMSIACFSHPQVLIKNAVQLKALLEQPYPTMAMLSSFATGKSAGRPEVEFLGDHEEQIFGFRTDNQLPPTPRYPLRFPDINTFLLALCAVVLGKPRRVFLFGFDQRVEDDDPSKDSGLYYKELDERYHAQDRSDPILRQHVRDWVRWDAIQVNEVSVVTLRMLSLMFNIELPMIFNVCPDSALEGFPKIDVNKFAEIVAQ